MCLHHQVNISSVLSIRLRYNLSSCVKSLSLGWRGGTVTVRLSLQTFGGGGCAFSPALVGWLGMSSNVTGWSVVYRSLSIYRQLGRWGGRGGGGGPVLGAAPGGQWWGPSAIQTGPGEGPGSSSGGRV